MHGKSLHMKWIGLNACVVMLLTGVVAAIGGCQSTQMPWQKPAPNPAAEPVALDPLDAPGTTPVAGPGLVPSSTPRFKDVPLPMNAKEDPERTFVFQSSTLEMGRMVYSTKDDVNALLNFYIQESPNQGWTLQNVLEAQGKTLVYTKLGKRMEVNVQNLGMAKGRRLTITLIPDSGSVSGGTL